MTLFGYQLKPLAKQIVRDTLDDNILGLASETAWSFFFGVFPAILFGLPIVALFGAREQLIDDMLRYVNDAVPYESYLLISRIVQEIVATNSAPQLISVGLLFALWPGSGIFTTLMSALNRAYEIKETRPWWLQRLIGIGCLLIGVIAIGFSTTTFVAGQQIIGAIVRLLRLDQFGTIVWTGTQYLLAIGFVVAFIWMLYLVLPNAKQNRRTAFVGAILATFLWLLFTIGFRIYAQNFGSYNKAYGAIGAVMVLLTWMYWTMFVVLVGGETSAALQKGVGRVRTRSQPHPPKQ